MIVCITGAGQTINTQIVNHRHMLTEAQKSWLACAIDSEGSIGLYHYKDGRRLEVTLTNNNMDYIKHAQQLVGIRGTIYTDHRGGNRKDTHHYTVDGRRVIPVLKEIFPYLFVKKQKLQSIFNELEACPLGTRTQASRDKFSAVMKQRWQNEKYRANFIAQASKPRNISPETRESMRQRFKIMRNTDPRFQWDNQIRSEVSAKAKKRWSDPAFKEMMTTAMRQAKVVIQEVVSPA